MIAAAAAAIAGLFEAGFASVTVERTAHTPARRASTPSHPMSASSGHRRATILSELRCVVAGGDGRPFGEILVANPHRGVFSADDVERLQSAAETVSALLSVAAGEPDLTAQAEGAFMALAAALDERGGTASHRAGRIAAICDLVGRALGLDESRRSCCAPPARCTTAGTSARLIRS
ncbi:MAG: hypothetical protein FJ029_11520 [Actinobacteria bacterium]|nr:hypothetical protein [Actinomycetota bacterium]